MSLEHPDMKGCDTGVLEANEKLMLHMKFVGSQFVVNVHVVYAKIASEALL